MANLSISIDVTGAIAGLERIDRDILRGLVTGIVRASRKIGILYRAEAKRRAPRATSRMARGIKLVRQRQKGVPRGSVMYDLAIISRDSASRGGKLVWYLPIVESRTGFLKEARAAIEAEAERIAREEVIAAIRERIGS